MNGAGSLEIVVTHPAADNTISRLIGMVEEAQERRAPAQRFVDQFARYYATGRYCDCAFGSDNPTTIFRPTLLEPGTGCTWLALPGVGPVSCGLPLCPGD
ncbi:MAG: hypothetical protein R3C44_02530 [Chloroflexota bacterium]